MNSVKAAGADASVQMECLDQVTELMGETKKALDALVKVTDEAAQKKKELYRQTSITLTCSRLWRLSALRLTNWR